MTQRKSILLTGVGSTTAQSVIKGLRAQKQYKVSIVGTDCNPASTIAGPAFTDKFYQIPSATEGKRYIESINEIINDEKIDLLIPIVDKELDVLSRFRERLNSECELLISPRDAITVANDKVETYEWMQDEGIPTVKTLFDPTAEEIESEFGDNQLIAKPRQGVSSRNVYEIRTPEELTLLKRIENPIVQPKITGKEYTIDVFRGGGDISIGVRERVDTRSGLSYKGRTVQDEVLEDYAEEIATKLQIEGPANIQAFKPDERVTFFEINPRFSGSLPLSIEAGLNSPLMALQWAADDEISHPAEIQEVQMTRYWGEVFHSESRTFVRRYLTDEL